MRLFTADGREFYRRGRFIRICGLYSGWYESVEDPEAIITSLKNIKPRLHIFTFFQRPPHVEPEFNYKMEKYSVSVIKLKDYDDWWNNSIKKKTRQAVNKAYKQGVEIRVADFDDDFVKGISEIYNETPFRAGKKFPHYTDSLEKVRRENETFPDRSIFLGAYHEGELIGFTKLVFEEEFVDILQHLAKMTHRDKNPTNALMAKSIEICAERGHKYLAYGDYDSSGIADYKRHNGFTKMDLPRYYIPLNWAGSIILKLGFHRPLSNLLPTKVFKFLRDFRRMWYEKQID